MGTTVLYNDVYLYNVQTRQWDEEIVYDESHTDLLYHRYKLRFEAVVHGHAVTSADPMGMTMALGMQDTVANRYDALRTLLGQPRRPLKVMMTDAAGAVRTVLEANPAAAATNTKNIDVDNGPKPYNVEVVHLAGLNCWRVAFAIDVALIDCPGISAVPLVLNNRWSVTEEMDDAGFIVRTVAGRLRLAIAETLVVKIASQAPWRQLVVPNLEFGFKRDRLEFTTSANGLDCDYRVTDRQVHTAAPWPASKMDMTHTESTSDGLSVSSECSVRLEGPPHVSKTLLITRGIQCIEARLKFLANKNSAGKPRYYVEDGRVVDHVGDRNVIEVSLRIRQVPGENEALVMLTNISATSLGQPLKLPPIAGEPEAYDPQKNPLLDPYGYTPGGESRVAVLAVLACYLQSPCDDAHGSPQPTEETPTVVETPQRDEGAPPGAASDTLSRGNDLFSVDTRTAFYTMCVMHNEYITNACRVALPKAWTPASSNAAGQDTALVFQLGAGISYRRIVFDAERVGEWPQIPEPVDFFVNNTLRGVLLSQHVNPHAPTLANDHVTGVYRIHGEYLYVLNRPPAKVDLLNVGVLPFINSNLADTAWNVYASYNKQLGP